MLRCGVSSILFVAAHATPGGDIVDSTVLEITSLQRLVRLLRDGGQDPRDVARLTGVAEDLVDASDGFIALHDFCAFYDLAAARLGDPLLALRVASAFEPADYGMMGHLFKVQPTFDSALDTLEHYYNEFLAEAELRIVREPARTRVQIAFHHEHPGLDHLRLEILAIAYRSLLDASTVPFPPRHMQLRRPPPTDPAPYTAFFRVPVQFGAPTDEIQLDPAPLARPNPSADPKLARLLIEAAEAHIVRRRAAANAAAQLLRLEGVTIDLRHGLVVRGAERVALTTKERELLQYFSDRPNQIVHHDDLDRDVWHLGRSVVSHAPAVAIRRLRQKIEVHPRRPVNLVTVFGEGWRLIVPEEQP